jgi:catechol 2,3-dioxygenase-like lactoylglutathione lyase family enzyme
MAVLGVLHAGLTVSDLDRAVDWYVTVLGLQEVHRQVGDNDYTRTLVGVPDAVIRVAQLALPGRSSRWPSSHAVELIEYTRGLGSRVGPAPNDVGASHLAFVVDDVNAVCARAIASGARLRNQPVMVTAGVNRGSKACYLHDLDGHTLEFMEYGVERAAALRAG